MGENVGGAVAKPLFDKLGGGRGNGRRGEHGHSEERVVRKSRLGPTPSQTNAPDRTPDTPQPQPPHVALGFTLSQTICAGVNFFSLGEDVSNRL